METRKQQSTIRNWKSTIRSKRRKKHRGMINLRAATTTNKTDLTTRIIMIRVEVITTRATITVTVVVAEATGGAATDRTTVTRGMAAIVATSIIGMISQSTQSKTSCRWLSPWG